MISVQRGGAGRNKERSGPGGQRKQPASTAQMSGLHLIRVKP